MPDTATALAWVVDVLQRHRVPFQAVGGLAPRAYGATRPLVDLDFDIPMARFPELLPDIAPHGVRSPERYRDANQDITFAKRSYAGQPIELGHAADARFFDRASRVWVWPLFAAWPWRAIAAPLARGCGTRSTSPGPSAAKCWASSSPPCRATS